MPVLSADAPPLLPLRDTRQAWLIYLLVMVAVSWACFGSLADHLLDTHDQEIFDDSSTLSKDFSYFFLPADQKEVGSGRPMSDLVRWLAFVAWGANPRVYHLLLAAVHTLASFLLARLAWRLGMSLPVSWVGGLLFLTNVAHFQAVHWISAIDYPLALVWGLGAVLCYLAYLRQPIPAWLGAFYLMLFFVAMTHLAMLVVWPFCFYWAWLKGLDLRAARRQLLPFGLILIPSLVFIVYLTASHTSTIQAIGAYSLTSLFSRLIFMARLLLWFLSRLLTTAHWLPLQIYQQQTWELLLGAGLLTGLGWLVWKRDSPAASWAVWTLVTLLPFLLMTEDIVFNLQPYPARYLYFASAGSSLILAWALQEASLRLYLKPQVLYPILTALLLVSSYFSLKASEALSFYSSARHYLSSGETDLAIERFQRAIDQAPDAIPLENAYERLCIMLAAKNQQVFVATLGEGLARFPLNVNLNIYKHVFASLESAPNLRQQAQDQLARLINGVGIADPQAIRLSTANTAHIYANIGWRLEEEGDLDRAVDAYQYALRLNRTNKNYSRITRVLIRISQSPDSATRLSRLAGLYPDIPYLKALTLKLQGQYRAAIEVCQQALTAAVSKEVLLLLGDCYEAQGNHAQARAEYQRAISLFPDFQPAYIQLAHIYMNTGEVEAALEAYSQALSLGPNSTAQYNLGLAYLLLGRETQARAAYAEGVEKYGAGVAVEAGSVDDLRQLVQRGIQATVAQEILTAYWKQDGP